MSSDCMSASPEEKKVIGEIIIPAITDNYEKLKNIVINTLVEMPTIVYVDDVFKKFTSYPVQFFFDEDLLDHVRQNYEALIKFVLDIPKIEAKVIDPLDFMRMRLSNQIGS